MMDYIVHVKYDHSSILNKVERFRVTADNEDGAKKKAMIHPMFPKDGEITRVRMAAYKKRKQDK